MNLSESQLSVLHTLSWTSIDHELEPFSEHLPDDACEGHAKGHARRKRAHETLAKNLTEFRKEPFDGLVISTNYDVTSVVKALLKYIGGSRTVVVYSPYKETLTGCFDYMRASSEFVNVQITESWLREYQVLPGRTHPFMTMSGSGGYILTAIRIFSSFVPSNTRAK
ncbi:tRNA (adenine(58)-N(1))-methyltransferase non-catalytic subunit TRM6 [Zancudomyces culisetae]|uniref:tRNA (adenine(58)-N(1))-methyltransferase non-catalytic subunit TRM6 n=1 Tax=Zancudomyces culisetae TaxID=1213189 RepID=A0A1R1PVR6_ZANCU|nr:tRNA (adenine(58)-N(1))-methyltransferase non-catalytic subunit TRM6 [Zancudomyces culisetae]OMH85067.1 tRNA (adenine(58)-N(1))-methyltransferase non-catalytic subunit TRM6 [Zancudomyces culisetae]|eukprot:OMH78565.1 tRNA (adenine(58)-N(1))-methyltransferase non-catalytic subunit TRM6 [Zancudomyces culisetae]